MQRRLAHQRVLLFPLLILASALGGNGRVAIAANAAKGVENASSDPRVAEAAALAAQVQRHLKAGELAQAIATAKSRVALLREITPGDDDRTIADALAELADLCARNQDFKAEAKYRQQSAAIRQRLDASPWKAVDARLAAEYSRQINRLTPEQRTRWTEANQWVVAAGAAAAKGEPGAALDLQRKALDAYRELFGDDQPVVAAAWTSAGFYARENQQYALARDYYDGALIVHRRIHGDNHPDTARALRGLGIVLDALELPVEALPTKVRAMSTFAATLGADSEDALVAAQVVAAALSTEGRSSRALEHAREVDVLMKARTGLQAWQKTDARVLIECLERLAALTDAQRAEAEAATQLGAKAYEEYSQKRLKEALELQSRVLETQRKLLGDRHIDVASALYFLGFLAQQRGDFAAAKRLNEEALEIRIKVLGEMHPWTARSMVAVANARNFLGDHEGALAMKRRAAAAFAESLGEANDESLSARESLASELAARGDVGGARIEFEKLLTLKQKRFGEQSLEAATAAGLLAKQMIAAADFAAARRLLEPAIEVVGKLRGDEHADVADPLELLGICLVGLGDDANAHAVRARALRIRQQSLGDEHDKTLASMLSVADDVAEAGDFKRARDLFEHVLRVRERRRADDGLLHQRFGRVLVRMGEYADAIQHFELALDRFKTAPIGSNASDTGYCLCDLGKVRALTGQWNDALTSLDAGRRLIAGQLARGLAGLSDREQLGFLALSDELAFHQALSLAIARPDDPSVAARTAEWLVNRKGIATTMLAGRALRQRQAATPAQQQLAREWSLVRELLARYSVEAATTKPTKERQREIAQLEADEQQLGRMLGLSSVELASLQWIELHQLRRNLPADAVLIDVARVREWDYAPLTKGGKLRTPRYVAWIVPASGRGEPAVVDLGDASRIDAAVAAFTTELKGAPARINDVGEADAETAARVAGSGLARLILEPIRRRTGDDNRWLLCPDAALWLVPWEALPIDNRTYAVERLRISYLANARDLLPAAAPKDAATGDALVLGDPDFDLQPVLTPKTLPVPADELAVRGSAVSRETIPTNWRRLTGTTNETAALAPTLGKWLGRSPRVVTRADATESAFKALRRPNVVWLSTHGFFLGDQFSGASGSLIGGPADALENPLLRCGLVLAGANRRGSTATGADDGILTGLEIVGADLRGTDLVVLSACDTGLGETRLGEGVAGLRQAFLLAGAKSVVATLWKVPDQPTVALATQFVERLAVGDGKADALRNAQLAVIAARRKQPERAAHPFFWAAFTLTGQWK